MPITLGLRPHIAYTVPSDPEKVGAQIREKAAGYPIADTGHYFVVSIPEDRRHYWSPQLQVTLSESEEGARVSGLITPMPAVWTLFAMTYIGIIVLGFFATIYGLAQRTLGNSSPALWSAPIALTMIGCVYAAAQLGQRIGHDQTEELLNILNSCRQQS